MYDPFDSTRTAHLRRSNHKQNFGADSFTIDPSAVIYVKVRGIHTVRAGLNLSTKSALNLFSVFVWTTSQCHTLLNLFLASRHKTAFMTTERKP